MLSVPGEAEFVADALQGPADLLGQAAVDLACSAETAAERGYACGSRDLWALAKMMAENVVRLRAAAGLAREQAGGQSDLPLAVIGRYIVEARP